MLTSEVGAYLQALLAQWQTGELQAIPDDPERLSRICGGQYFTAAVRAKFKSIEIEGGLFLQNVRLAGIWKKQKAVHDAQVQAGKLRAEQAAKLEGELDKNPEPITQNKEQEEKQNSYRAQAREVFSYWQSIMKKPKAILGEKREKVIIARIKAGYSVDDIKQAIDGCKQSPHHQGQNERKAIYDDLELICRDEKHVDQFMSIAVANSNGNRQKPPHIVGLII